MLPILKGSDGTSKAFLNKAACEILFSGQVPGVSSPNQPATQSFIGKTLLYRINTHYMYINKGVNGVDYNFRNFQLWQVTVTIHKLLHEANCKYPDFSNKHNDFLKWPPFFNRTKHTQHISGIYPLQNWRNNKNRGMFPLQNFNVGVGHQPLEIICAKQPVKLLTPLFDSLEAERAALEREKLCQAPWKRKKTWGMGELGLRK